MGNIHARNYISTKNRLKTFVDTTKKIEPMSLIIHATFATIEPNNTPIKNKSDLWILFENIMPLMIRYTNKNNFREKDSVIMVSKK